MEKSVNNLKFAYENKKYPSSFQDYLDEVEFLLGKAEECQNIIKEYDNLSDINFYKRLLELDIDTDLKRYEYANILGIHYNKEFRGTEVIQTTFKVKTGDYVGHGKDMEYRTMDSALKLEVAYVNNISTKHFYTKDEIDELLRMGYIVILRKEIDWFVSAHGNEICPKCDIESNEGNIYSEFTDFDGKYYESTLKYMRKKFNKENLNVILDKLVGLVRAEMNIMSTIEEMYKEKGFQKKLSKLENK